MWVQAVGIGIVIVSSAFGDFVSGLVLLGIGTAMVYPTLLSAVGDVVPPLWRASSVGIYRLWRDLGYAVGALLALYFTKAPAEELAAVAEPSA